MSAEKKMDEPDSDDDLPLSHFLMVSRNEDIENNKQRSEHYDRLMDLLTINGYMLVKVQEDGDCAFSALQTQMLDDDITVASLRQLTSSHLREHWVHYKPLTSLGNDYEEECEKMNRHGYWKSELCDIIPMVFSNMTQLPVLMFTSDPSQQYMEFHPSFSIAPVFAIKTPMVHLARCSLHGQEHFDSFVGVNFNTVRSGDQSMNCTSCSIERQVLTEEKKCDEPLLTTENIEYQIEDDGLDEELSQVLDECINSPTSTSNVEKWFNEEMDTIASSTNPLLLQDPGNESKSCESQNDNRPSVILEIENPQVTQTEENEDASYRKRKRSKFRSPETWQKNIRKKLRNEGSEYIGTSGKLVKKRSMGPACKKCHFECRTNFSSEDREKIFSTFWGSGSKKDQSAFIINMVDEEKPARKKVNAKVDRDVVRSFHLPIGPKKIRVCKMFFLSTLNISSTSVATALRNSSLGVSLGDQRGKHTPCTKISDNDCEFVKEHISSFPKLKPHYNRHDSTRDYLDKALNLRSMYSMYEECCEQHGRAPVKEHKYRQIFHENFNLTFHRPKKDSCLACDKHENGILGENLYLEHIKRKDAAQQEKQKDKERAKADATKHMCTFDLEQVLSTPSTSTNTIYYKRKLNVYNLSVYSCGTGSGTCMLWNESEGMRGANEIGTCIHTYLLSLPPIIDHVTLYSDNCGGQNKNKFFPMALILALKESSHLQMIDHKFLERGHSHMEVDSVHAAVEYAKKNIPVYVPRDWETVCRFARKRKRAYNVLSLTHKNFINLKDMSSTVPVLSQIAWQKVCWVRYVKVLDSLEIQVMFKYDFSGEFESVNKKKTRNKANEIKFVHEPLYTSRLAVSEGKKTDLLSLCKDGTIPAEFHSFYEELPTKTDICDRVPVTDEEEMSEDEE